MEHRDEQKNNVNNIAKFNLSIFEKTSQRFSRYCELDPLDFEITSTEMYYALSYDKWGKGYATEATYALLQYAFKKKRDRACSCCCIP